MQVHLGIDRGTPTYKRFILTHHKNLNRGDILVDDRPGHNGADRFEGELVHFGEGGTFRTWPGVVEHLRNAADLCALLRQTDGAAPFL